MLIQQTKEFMFENDLKAMDLAKLLGISANYTRMLLRGDQPMTERMEYKIKKLLSPTKQVQNNKSKRNKNGNSND